MNKKWFRSGSVILCCGFLLGCTPVPDTQKTPNPDLRNPSADTTEEKEYQQKLDIISPNAYSNPDGIAPEAGMYISIIGKRDKGSFWQEMERGARQAVSDINERMGFEGEDKIRLAYNGPGKNGGIDEQVNILDEELARYPSAIGISLVDDKACEVQFDLALEGGIPIVAVDSGNDYPGLNVTVSTNNISAGSEAADRMAEQVGEEGDVIILISDSGSRSGKDRKEGFETRMKEAHPKIRVVKSYYMDTPEEYVQPEKKEDIPNTNPENGAQEETAEKKELSAKELVQDILQTNPDISGIYATESDTLRLAAEAVKARQQADTAENEQPGIAGTERIRIIGFDQDEKIRSCIAEGLIDGTIVQNPFGMGYASVIACTRAAMSMGNEAFVDTGYFWLSKQDEENEDIKKMLY